MTSEKMTNSVTNESLPTKDRGAAAVGSSRARGMLLALAMLLAPWGFVITNLCYALAIRGGGSEDSGLDSLALFAAHPELVRVGTTAGMIGCLLLIPAVLGVLRLARTSRLVLVGGSLMVAGYACYLSVLDRGFVTLTMALRGDHLPDYAAVLEAAQGESVWVFLIFVVGNLIGTALLASGLLASRSVSPWAAVAILCWPPLHVFGLVVLPNEVPQVIGAVLQAIGFAGCAARLLRDRPNA